MYKPTVLIFLLISLSTTTPLAFPQDPSSQPSPFTTLAQTPLESHEVTLPGVFPPCESAAHKLCNDQRALTTGDQWHYLDERGDPGTVCTVGFWIPGASLAQEDGAATSTASSQMPFCESVFRALEKSTARQGMPRQRPVVGATLNLAMDPAVRNFNLPGGFMSGKPVDPLVPSYALQYQQPSDGHSEKAKRDLEARQEEQRDPSLPDCWTEFHEGGETNWPCNPITVKKPIPSEQ